MSNALWAYARFHEKIYPYRSSFLVAKFEEITKDFGEVTQRCNAKFHTNFAVFDHSKENVERCFALIDHRSRQPSWRKALGDYQSGLIDLSELQAVIAEQAHESDTNRDPHMSEQLVARPSQARDEMKATLKDRYHGPEMRKLRTRAERAYHHLVEAAR